MKRTLLVVALVGSYAHAGQQGGYPPIVTTKNLYAKNDLRGKKSPDFVVEEWLSAKPEMKGKILFIDFWATWCGPCVALIPKLNDWHAKFGKDVVFIGISDEKADVVRKFQQKTKMAYPQAIDTKSRMSNALGVQGIPHVMIVTPDGICRWQGFPGSQEDPLTEDTLKSIITAYRASK